MRDKTEALEVHGAKVGPRINATKTKLMCIIVHTGLMTFYSRTFQGLSTIFKESISTSMISHLFNSYSKNANSVSANNVIQPVDPFSFSSIELNFLSEETRSLSLSFADYLKAFP